MPVITGPPWYVTFPEAEAGILGVLAAVPDAIAARALEVPGATMSVRAKRNRTIKKRTVRAAFIGMLLSHGQSQAAMMSTV